MNDKQLNRRVGLAPTKTNLDIASGVGRRS